MKLSTIQPGTYILAVSGGVDSVVLLDMISRLPEIKITVAHFDHGIRTTSHQDAEFVKALCKEYGAEYVSERIELGKEASEEAARMARYAYLQKIKKHHSAAAIVTAHHAGDVLETIIINIIRGTGWRGLSVLRSENELIRPLLKNSKQEIYDYAKKNKLSWQEDETNQDTRYLRNYVRLNLTPKLSDEAKQQLLQLHDEQVLLRQNIHNELSLALTAATKSPNEYSRYFFTATNPLVAYELLKSLTGATRPQLEKAVIAIKTAKMHSRHQVGNGIELRFTKTTFIVVRPYIVVS